MSHITEANLALSEGRYADALIILDAVTGPQGSTTEVGACAAALSRCGHTQMLLRCQISCSSSDQAL
jgi:hypothetical protein